MTKVVTVDQLSVQLSSGRVQFRYQGHDFKWQLDHLVARRNKVWQVDCKVPIGAVLGEHKSGVEIRLTEAAPKVNNDDAWQE